MFIATKILKSISTSKPTTNDYDRLLPSFDKQKGITHNIFQTCKDKHELSAPLQRNIERIRQMNPDWAYQLFDDADIEAYIGTHYGKQILTVYHRIDSHYGAAKADFFRYLVIYREGGVYLDIKSTVDKPLSNVIQEGDSYILSYWNNQIGHGHEQFGHYPGLPDYIERGEIIQWYLAAAAGHPLLRRVILQMLSNIDLYNPYINGVGWMGTVSTTGPIMYTTCIWNALKQSPELYPVRWTDIIEDEGFRYSIFAQQGEKPERPAHTSHLPSDYRKAISPVIKHRCGMVNSINRLYLKFLHRIHR